MRKILLTIAMAAFICNGCAWLGSGDDTTVTDEAVAATDESQDVVTVASNEETSATAKKASSKSSKTAKSSQKGVKKSEAQIKAELDAMGKKLAAQSARTLLPNISHKEVKKVGNQWVASYIHVDSNNVRTEMRPGSKGQYVGFIRYQEEFMECRGATKQAALSAPCTKVRSRNLNELIHYDGRQWQD